MPACCICYTTDPAYLFPTFVSALQARRQSSALKADVLIFSFGSDSEAEDQFGRACAAEGITLLSVPMDAIDGAAVMLARLFLTRFAPTQYEHFLYIDGDTQVRGSLDPLIDAQVPPGQFMAANDPMTFALPGNGALSRDVRQHFSALGISLHEACNYFNTGVLRINRNGWERTGRDAWDLFRFGRQSRFPDQDVLNIVGGASRIPMSLAWNFPIFMRNSRVETEIAPRIYHFMSKPKPWQGTFAPWDAEAAAPYEDVIRRYPELAGRLSTMPPPTRLRYHLQQRYKQIFETLTWGFGARRERILSYERGLARGRGAGNAHGPGAGKAVRA
jgi:hypothetical protein